MPLNRTKAGAGMTMPLSVVASCPVDERAVGISIGEEFQKMRRRFDDGTEAVRRRPHLVEGGGEQLSSLRREYQRRAGLRSALLPPVPSPCAGGERRSCKRAEAVKHRVSSRVSATGSDGILAGIHSGVRGPNDDAQPTQDRQDQSRSYRTRPRRRADGRLSCDDLRRRSKSVDRCRLRWRRALLLYIAGLPLWP